MTYRVLSITYGMHFTKHIFNHMLCRLVFCVFDNKIVSLLTIFHPDLPPIHNTTAVE